MNRIVVFAAHPDDELLGVGGTIRKLVNEGVEAHAVILAEGITSRFDKRDKADLSELDKLKENAREAASVIGYNSIEFCNFPDNRMDSIDLLDVIKTVSVFVEKYSPDTIFTHHHGDLNIDHRRVCDAVLTACRPVGESIVKRIYTFETPSSTEWNFNYEDAFNPNVFFDVNLTIESKIKGMECYLSERKAYPHPRSSEALIALAKTRGVQSGFEMAEAFMLLREFHS